MSRLTCRVVWRLECVCGQSYVEGTRAEIDAVIDGRTPSGMCAHCGRPKVHRARPTGEP